MSAATVELTAENFEQTITDNEIVVIDFWAEWCGPCRAFAPVFEEAATAHPDIVFGKVDTEAQQALAASFDIRSIPTLVVFRDQVILYAQPGALPKAALAELVQKVRDVDMDDVRAKIAAQVS